MTVVGEPSVLQLDGTTGMGSEKLGGKAWSIERMRALGIPVPPAFALTTDVCRRFYRADDGAGQIPGDVWSQIPGALEELERATGRRFGGGDRPLLVSVRSGAATSMPGMMDTVLNLGMTNGAEYALAEVVGDPIFAADIRRRFLEQFTKIVGRSAPDDPWEQLRLAIVAVFNSWQSKRAIGYRRDHGIPDDLGTAVTVQAMVFGNLDERSGTGVLFTRNPLTGSSEPYGEWLPRGQGEDVVSGRSDALPLDELARSMPEAHRALMAAAARLEKHAHDVQDIEFTVEGGTLWLLQTRSAKRSPEAAVRHAVALYREGLITATEVLDRVTAEHVQAMLLPRVHREVLARAPVLATGKPACPGVATGIVVTDPQEAEDCGDGTDIVLVRPTTDPEDVGAMAVSRAVVTELGGATSHAAVVCREMGVPCVVGCGEETLVLLAGRTVTVDGFTGTVYEGALDAVEPSTKDDPDLAALASLAHEEAGRPGDLLELLRTRRNDDQARSR
ncbi:pyruvate, phosphate dikinase [Nocardia sp. R16R-3T]